MKLVVLVLALAVFGTAAAEPPSKSYRRWEVAFFAVGGLDLLSTSMNINTGGYERMAWLFGDTMEQIAPRHMAASMGVTISLRKYRKHNSKVALRTLKALTFLRVAVAAQNVQEYRR